MTELANIELTNLEIPFKTAFLHASAERHSTEAIIAVATSRSGITGYGEGCPRHYVTNETADAANRFLEENKSSILGIENIGSLRAWVKRNEKIIDDKPAAWCAIETAILDLLGRGQGKSIDALLDLPELSGNFAYTAVLGVADNNGFRKQLKQYLQLNISDFKMKLSGVYEADRTNIDEFRELENIKVRIDVNNLWHNVDQAVSYLQSLQYAFWAIEEPLQVGDYSSMGEVAKALNSQIILDESFLRLDQLKHFHHAPHIWIPNMRISKMGGLIRSLGVAEEVTRRGMKFVIGAHVGETSILTRVALSVANNYRHNLLAQEGAFGTYLLERDITKNPIMFASKGLVTPQSIAHQGLGLDCTL